MKARSIARELALLGASQLTDSLDTKTAAEREPLSNKQLDALLLKALTALSADAQESIETAEGELQRGERLILESETRTIETDKVRSRIQLTVPLIETAINRVGSNLELLVFARQGGKRSVMAAQNALESAASLLEKGDQLLLDNERRAADISEARQQIQQAIAAVKTAIAELKQSLEPATFAKFISQTDIRGYAGDLLYSWTRYWQAVDVRLDEAMEKWNIRRLARVDRDILRLAMIEIMHLSVPKRVAIDEAIEMAKRYSDEEGYRFINGVLRRATDKLESTSAEN
ncbi:transcription antitermination factor NusB [Leptolyngbya sp. BC1307]|uniref:transcription antitermination factor NusB n=1 Tax=Leptolyngbya sp. BC1307 TaxID=2029589 RepID=UPI000EFC8B3C|nr:transcription antitermination factor NusB [Leptolyngbya sp. BC1307]